MFVAVLSLGEIYADVRYTKNEHRGVWVSPYVSDWPGTNMTDKNVQSVKTRGYRMLDTLSVNNYTTVYFHVRTLADAMYESSYEPWSSTLTGTRGKKPPFDPLKFIVDECHKRGLECYAWINPFRYTGNNISDKPYGAGELNYENSHPEWLMKNHYQYVLNPGLPEVHDQIVKVCKEIITKYDVDGLVMDDYFYPQGGTDYVVDADLYQKYVENGGTMDQGDWRRDNINRMIDRLGKELKAVKPWIRYGVSPAGGAGKSAAEHGLPGSPATADWQYGQIYSDPLAWMFNGSIDFISPQLYWPIGSATNEFKVNSQWWQLAADESNCHFFPSQSYERGKYKFTEYRDEMNWLRQNTTEDGATGMVIFKYSSFLGERQTVTTPDGKKVAQSLYDQIRATAQPYKSYTPVMNWDSNGVPEMPDNVKNNAGTLSWTGPENVRFAVYAYPESEKSFSQEVEYLLGLSYSKSYTIGAKYAKGFKYAVASVDRWGMESGAALEGQPLKAAPALKMMTPTQNSKMYIFSDFSWQGECTSFVLEVAKDAAMKDILFSKEVASSFVARQAIRNIDNMGTYYCRVTGKTPGYKQAVSDIVKFEIVPFDITYPANGQIDVELTPNVQWTDLNGADYKITIAKDKAMQDVVFEQETKDNNVLVSQFKLFSGVEYYAQVSAGTGMRTGTSVPVKFKTIVMEPVAAQLLNPANDGDVVYSNQVVRVAPKPGVFKTRIEISKTTSFSSRSAYTKSLVNLNFEDDVKFGDMKVAGKSLVDGETYHMRVRHEVVNKEGKTQNGEWTLSSFVYSKDLGVDATAVDQNPYISGTTLVIPQVIGDVAVYNASGAVVYAENSVVSEMSLDSLAKGMYIVRVSQQGKETVLKFIR